MNRSTVLTLCRCGATTRDGAAVCEGCLTSLYNLLTDDVPWLDEQLDVSLAGIRGVSLRGSQHSTETGLNIYPAVSSAHRNLQRTLSIWVRFCLEHDVRNSSPNRAKPADNARLYVLAEWLSWRVDGLAWHPAGYNARSGIEAAVNRARDVVLWKPPVRVFLGRCGLPTTIKNEETGKYLRCQGDVYATEGEDTGHCRSCGQSHLVAGLRAKLEAELDDQLCTAADIARMMVYLGAEVPRIRVRNRINQWYSRGVITAANAAAVKAEGAEPRFRYGDLRERLAAEYQHRDTA